MIVRCSGLPNTTSCREAYLLTLENLADAKRIFPHKKLFLQGELELAASCRKQISEGEAAAFQHILPLAVLQSNQEYQDLLYTVCVYLLDKVWSIFSAHATISFSAVKCYALSILGLGLRICSIERGVSYE